MSIIVDVLVVCVLLVSLFLLHLLRNGPKYSLQPATSTYFRGKYVWITGASSGIGRAIAILVDKCGGNVILSGRDKIALEDVRSEILSARTPTAPAKQIPPICFAFDLATLGQAEDLGPSAAVVQEVFERISPNVVSVLVNNAGMSVRGSCQDTLLRVDKALMDVNYFGQIAFTKAFISTFFSFASTSTGLPSSSSSATSSWPTPPVISVISSVQGYLPVPLRSAYSASKHAVHAFFSALRYELPSFVIQIVSPGYVQTNLSLNALRADGTKWGRLDETTRRGLKAEAVAIAILNAIVEGKEELIIDSLKTRAGVALSRLFPSIIEKTLKKKYEEEKQQLQAAAAAAAIAGSARGEE